LGSNDPFLRRGGGQIIVPLPVSRRILVFGSHFVRSLVRDIVEATPDLRLVGEGNAEPVAIDAAAGTAADFVIVSVRDPALAGIHLQLLEERPLARVLAVAGSGEEASLWQLRPEQELIGDISPETLLEAIRRPDWRSVRAS
jgi:DNA-binding NarL/FixJ family response regulator